MSVPPPKANANDINIQTRPPVTPRQRPGQARPRPSTARPDTSASGIGPLPDQTFYAEGEEFEEEEEEYSEEEPEADGVFAFNRPITSAQHGVTFSEHSASAPGTGLIPPPTGTTNFRGGTFGASGLDAVGESTFSDVPAPTGAMDVGGHLPELTYDKSNPAPLSGSHNLNNSSFAFNANAIGDGKKGKQPYRPPTGRSLLDRLQRRNITTASTQLTSETGFTTTTDASAGRTSLESGKTDDSGSYATTEIKDPQHVRRMRSSQPLIPSTAGSGMTSQTGTETRRGMSRGSYGMTELTGDETVPDGKTTYGNGMRKFNKENSDEGSAMGIELDMIEEDSPYPEVRASVSNIDDPEMPALTIRSWVIGIFFAVCGTAVNTFFSFRNPAPSLSPLLVQVAAYPVGRFFAWIVPYRTFRLPVFLGSSRFSFNPGPFNIKEHTIIVIMANVSLSPAYALYATVSSELYYGHDFGVGFNILFVLITQMTGFAFAGMCRRFVIWPASMIWPTDLVVATNLNTFHAEDNGATGGMTRYKFFMIAGTCAFAWYFLPGFVFSALSYFSFACWIAPTNRVVNQLFGVSTGLGMGVLTFDWSQITYFGSPLTTPWWAAVNVGVGFVLFYWILVPILYYTNVWNFAYQPISTSQVGDRFGSPYDIFNVITPDITLNETAYAEYSPVYLSASFAMTFMLAFALSTGLLVHTALHHGPRIYRAIINVKSETDDIHMKLMRQYPEVPNWWYYCLGTMCFVMAVVAIEVFHTGLPVWGYLLCVLIPFIYVLPAAFIYAMTNQLVAINLLAELIPGYLFSGKPIPGMIFKVFSVQTVTVSLTFLQDQKLAHYMKVPPRSTFIAQISGTVVACFVQIGTKKLLFNSVPDICQAGQKNLLTCAATKVFFTSSIIWGLIGPQRLFSQGSLYHPQLYAWLVGAILPIPLWFWVRRYPRSILRNMNLPVIFSGALYIPPATGINYASWLLTGFIFQFWARRRRFAWWSKYNYVLSAALDVGTVLCAVFIFLVLDLPGAKLEWWGNSVYTNTMDWDGAALYDAPPTGFGPETWKV